jgi:hypothetical protein
LIAAGVMAITAVGVGPAFAEGGWNGFIGGWLPGRESRHWEDRNTDAQHTRVIFSGCSARDTANVNRFRYAGIQLKKERPMLPDPVVGRDNNYCDTSNFGDRSAGWYYFSYANLNGADSTYYRLKVSSVKVRF